MDFFCTSSFTDNVSILCKKAKNNYFEVCKDISELLQIRTDVSQIIASGDVISMVNEKDKLVLIKIRVKNSAMKEGTRGGFRLIILVNQTEDVCVLLSIYPKKGKLAKIDLSEDEYANILEIYLKENKAKKLIPIDINSPKLFK